jgi:hypothetical protein
MADFRKLLLALMAGALLFTTVASAAQYSCKANAVPTLVRSEGIAELVGDVLLNCDGDVPAAGILANVRLKLTANITSNPAVSRSGVAQVGDLTDAMLILDNGADAFRGYSSTSPLTVFSDGTQNLYQAVKISDDEIEWQGVWLAAVGSTGYSKSIRLTNVRGNVQSRGDFATIYASINITGSTTVPVDNNLLVVADTRPGMTFDVTPASYRNCVDPAYSGEAILKFTEGFGSAFRPKGTASTDNTKPGGGYRNESGFNPGSIASGTLVNQSGIGQASYGTRLFVRMKDIPSGISHVRLQKQIVTGYGMVLQLVTGVDSSGAGGSMSSGTGTSDDPSNNRFVYEVTDISANSYAPYAFSETVSIPVAISYSVPGPVGTASASGTLAPISSVFVMDWNSYEPRFVDKGVDKTMFTIDYCRTILLFPYVTNQANFDTGLAIANTSKDPIYTGSAATKAQSGTCTLYYYGNTSGGPAPAAQTTPTVAAGGHFVMQLSGGGGVFAPDGGFTACASGACIAPLFQGYIFALCNFQFAHGYAFISDYGSVKLAQGYLALVVPDRSSRLPVDSSYGSAINQGEQLAQ